MTCFPLPRPASPDIYRHYESPYIRSEYCPHELKSLLQKWFLAINPLFQKLFCIFVHTIKSINYLIMEQQDILPPSDRLSSQTLNDKPAIHTLPAWQNKLEVKADRHPRLTRFRQDLRPDQGWARQLSCHRWYRDWSRQQNSPVDVWLALLNLIYLYNYPFTLTSYTLYECLC